MISLGTSKRDAASFGMILASIIMHGLFLGLIVATSSWLWYCEKPKQEEVTRVTLLPSPGPVVAEKIQSAPVEPAANAAEEEVAHEEPVIEKAEASRETVQPKLMDRVPGERIAMAKRKRPPLKTEAPKEPPKSKPESDKKKEDPDSYLEKQKAAIAKQVANQKKEGSPGRENRPSGALGNQADGVKADRELSRWFDSVKSRINDHWSLVGEKPQPDVVTIIGIQISDTGAVVRASVDTSSGDRVFDSSAMRAIYQASPFPPLPTDAREKIQRSGGLALRFTPRGAQ